jgi:hypothetical protein
VIELLIIALVVFTHWTRPSGQLGTTTRRGSSTTSRRIAVRLSSVRTNDSRSGSFQPSTAAPSDTFHRTVSLRDEWVRIQKRANST